MILVVDNLESTHHASVRGLIIFAVLHEKVDYKLYHRKDNIFETLCVSDYLISAIKTKTHSQNNKAKHDPTQT